MLGFLRRLLAPAEPSPPRLSARVTTLENLCDDFDSRIDYLASELKKVRGRQFALEKRSQDDVGPTNGEEPERDETPELPRIESTAHLARRFRSW